MAARRVPLAKPPTAADEARVERQQAVWRTRIGAKIRAARQEAGLSQQQLCMRANMSQNYLSECERGLRGLTVDSLVRLGHFLGKTPADFLSD